MSQHETFILKFSFDLDSNKWHGKLTHVATQEISYFTEFDDLIESITEFLPIEPNIRFEIDPVIDNFDIYRNNVRLENRSVLRPTENRTDMDSCDPNSNGGQ